MNVDTGELRRFEKEKAEELLKEEFVPVPKKHKAEANKELGDKDSVIVDMRKDTPLANWANRTRVANKKKARNKTARASRRRNRV